MSLTLPGTLPGLFRRCSPIVITETTGAGTCEIRAGQRGVVLLTTSGDVGPVVALADGRTLPIPGEHLALDLTDATGRSHAAWWARPRIHGNLLGEMADSPLLWGAISRADLSPEHIAALRDLCLGLAGVAHV